MVNELYQLKWEYNHTLTRYYNGCNYIEEHPEEAHKYVNKLLELLDKINELLEKINEMDKNFITDDEILGGFKLC